MRIKPEQLRSFSTANHPEGDRILRVLAAGLNAVDPYEAVKRNLALNRNILNARNRSYVLKNYKRIILVGAGKAAVPMTIAATELFGDLITSGIVITKRGHSHSEFHLPSRILILEGGHPLPDQQGVLASQKIIQLLANTQSDDLVLFLLSGGGSALLTSPQAGITLLEVQALTAQLLACGATIDELNTVRKHIDLVKGGGLVANAGPSDWLSLILSDVIGDPLDRIASGPTAPDPSTYEDAYNILEKYKLLSQTPEAVITHLKQGMKKQIPETPKPGDPVFNRVNNLIVGNNSLAAEAAIREATRLGFHTMLLTTSIQGEASQVGIFLAAVAQQIYRSNQPIPRPACLIAGGETTVTIRGEGSGGRNQELALGAVNQMAGLENSFIISLATDGGDGPTDAAGAVVTGDTLTRALSMGNHPSDYLARNDSYHFFNALEDLLKPGPTLTNVGDLTFVFAS